MPDGLDAFPISITGGIQDSRPIPEPGDLEELENFEIYRGRFALRASVEELGPFMDDQATPQEVDAIVGMTLHDGKIYAATFSSSQNKVYLHSISDDGTNNQNEGMIWSTVTQPTYVSMASITGGTGAGVSRLYIADYDGSRYTQYWVDGVGFTQLWVDFNNDDSSEVIYFNLVFPFQYRLWGAGFYEGTTARADIVRLSQPGLIPSNDIMGAGLTTVSREWFTDDWIPFGRRGDPITAMDTVADRLLVFQGNTLHAVYGSSPENMTVQQISDTIGCCDPRATATLGQYCYFFSKDGPYRTNGQTIEDIGEPVRRRITSVDTTEPVIAVASPDNQLVKFFVDKGSGVTEFLAFDTVNNRWMEGSYSDSAGTVITVGAGSPIISVAPPGPPAGPPSSLVVTAIDDDSLGLEWVNGDTSLITQTEIHRHTSSFTISGDTYLHDTVGSGEDTYTDTLSVDPDTTYYYRVRHIRSGQYSSASNEDSDTTWLGEPTAMWLAEISTGIRVRYLVPDATYNIRIERKKLGDASFTYIDTDVAPGAGIQIYNDTSTTCQEMYTYRVRSEKAGSTNSVWTYWTSGEEYVEACGALKLILTTDHSSVVTDEYKQIATVSITWTQQNCQLADKVWVYRDDNGAGYVYKGKVTATSLLYQESVVCANGPYRYRLELHINDGASSDDTNYEPSDLTYFAPCAAE